MDGSFDCTRVPIDAVKLHTSELWTECLAASALFEGGRGSHSQSHCADEDAFSEPRESLKKLRCQSQKLNEYEIQDTAR
jgi:hypothetical protein